MRLGTIQAHRAGFSFDLTRTLVILPTPSPLTGVSGYNSC
jgi:hypothetical protein